VKEAAHFVERSLTQVMFDHAASAKVAHSSYLCADARSGTLSLKASTHDWALMLPQDLAHGVGAYPKPAYC